MQFVVFLLQVLLSSGVNCNLMILIPKVPGANSMDRFRPIILSNFLFKVVTKILTDRLGTIASRIISKNQFGFLKGRHIEDCIVAASKCFNVMNRQCWGGNMAMKIDIKKLLTLLNGISCRLFYIALVFQRNL